MLAWRTFSTRRVLAIVVLTFAIAWAFTVARNTTPSAGDHWSPCASPAAACTNTQRLP